jgi:hypothetical protein
MKPITRCMEEAGISFEQLVEASGLDRQIAKSIVSGQYTPSPAQRERLASVLKVAVDQIAWGHTVPVEHMWGHGPQWGRTP